MTKMGGMTDTGAYDKHCAQVREIINGPDKTWDEEDLRRAMAAVLYGAAPAKFDAAGPTDGLHGLVGGEGAVPGRIGGAMSDCCDKCKEPIENPGTSYRLELPDFKGDHYVVSRLCAACFDKMDDAEKNARIELALKEHNTVIGRRYIDPVLLPPKEAASVIVRRLKAELADYKEANDGLRLTVEVAREENEELRKENAALKAEKSNAKADASWLDSTGFAFDRTDIDRYCIEHDYQLVTRQAFKELEAGVVRHAEHVGFLLARNKALRAEAEILHDKLNRQRDESMRLFRAVNDRTVRDFENVTAPRHPVFAALPRAETTPVVTFARLREGWTPPVSSEAKVLCPDASEEP